MATKAKEGSGHGKDKSSTSHSTSQNTDSPHAKRTQKPSASGSPGKDSSVLSEKSVPNYLKPTISSTHEAHKDLRKQHSEGSGTRRLTTRKSFDRHSPPSIEKHPPPSSSHAQKAPSTAAPKERTLRTSTSLQAPRVASSTTRTIPTKMVKTARIGRGKTMRKEVGGVKKKETKRSQSPVTSGTEGEEKEVIPDVTTEVRKQVDTEELQVEVVLPVADKEHADSPIEVCDSPTPVEEQEVVLAIPLADDRKTVICEDKVEHEVTKETEPVHDGDHTQQKSEESLAVKEQQVDEVGDGKQANEFLDDTPETQINSQVVVVTAESKGDQEIVNAAVNEGSNDKGTEEDDHERHHEAEEMEAEKVENMAATVENKAAKPRKDKDVRGKKEAPAAYNDVIEETASKLAAEQRKNKVKALAGAFETVISLQNPEG